MSYNNNRAYNCSEHSYNTSGKASKHFKHFRQSKRHSSTPAMSFSDTFKVYEEYFGNPEVVKADFNWEKGTTDEIFILKDGQKEYVPGTVKGKPVFEDGVLESLGQPSFKTWRRNGGTMVAQSRNWSAIIPGGFRGGETPNKMNPVSFEIGEYSALMGLIHLIAIPNKRITNCVTVTEEDVPLIEEGIQLLETSFGILANGGADEIGSLRWQLSQSGTIKMKDGSEKSARVTEEDFDPSCRDNFKELLINTQDSIDKMKMEVTCHASAMSSIRKLHLHGFSSDFKTMAWNKMEEKAQSDHGRAKNMPIEDIMYMAQSGKTKLMKDMVLMPPPTTVRHQSSSRNDDSVMFSQSV